MVALAADQANYKTAHTIAVTWDDQGAQPATFAAVRLYAVNLENLDERLVQSDANWGHHAVTDRFAETNVQIRYEVRNVVASGAETVQQNLTITTAGDDYWLIHPTDANGTVRLWHVTGDAYTTEHENSVLNLIDRGRKVDRGERWGVNGSLSAQLRDRTEMTARQQKIHLELLREEAVAMTLQTPYGDSWLVSLGDIAMDRQGGSGTSEHLNVTIPYLEVA